MSEKNRNMWIGLLLGLIACSSGCEGADSGSCTNTTVEDRQYCVASGPIIETGFDCPADMPHRQRQGDVVICSEQEEVPEKHRREIAENHGDGEYDPNSPSNGGGTGDSAQSVEKSALCGSPSDYDGKRISVSADAVELITATGGKLCMREPACCNSQRSLFVIACGDGPSDRENTVVLRPANGANFPVAVARSEAAPWGPPAGGGGTKEFGCAGQECYQVCTPGRLSQIDSFQGTFRPDGPFTIDEHPGAPEYGMKLEVDAVDYAGDGCPDFTSGCPTGCNEIEGKKLFREEGCMASESQVIGCTPNSGDGEVGCVKRDDTEHAHLYRIPESSTADGTDWVACTDQERTRLMENHPTCN